MPRVLPRSPTRTTAARFSAVPFAARCLCAVLCARCREIVDRTLAAAKEDKLDIHGKLMSAYKKAPEVGRRATWFKALSQAVG